MNEKTKKIISTVVNVLVTVILVLVVFITINILLSGNKGYTSFFGTAYMSVATDSMDGNEPDSFPAHTLIRVKILDDEQKKNLEIGDIITFYDYGIEPGQRVINTHRIVSIEEINGEIYYRTKGDNPNAGTDEVQRQAASVIGIYKGKVPLLGPLVYFFHTSTGFFVIVVIPSLLIVAYFAVNLILTVRKAKNEDNKEKAVDEKERMRQELLKELMAEGKITAEDVPSDADAPAEESSPEPADGNDSE